MKVIDFIYYIITTLYVLFLGILWGGYIAGIAIPLWVLICISIGIICFVVDTFFWIKE